MNEDIEYKTYQNDEWKAQHILTKDQLNKLIEEKIERAKVYQKHINRYVVKQFD